MQKIHTEENIKILNEDYYHAEIYQSLWQKEKYVPLDKYFYIFFNGSLFSEQYS